jgi:oligopeptide transport system substrate-binding protein
VKNIADGEIVELVRNENYWQRDIEGFGLPYIDGVNFFFNSKLDEIKKFKKKELSIIKDIPVNQISNILPSIEEAKEGNNSDFNYLSAEGLDVKIICFNHEKEIFKNLDVRKAFNYAIDKEKLVDSILLGDRNIANHGLIPRSKIFGSYEVKGYSFDPAKAKQHLAKAGYPNGQDFPEITIHSINRPTDSTAISEAVKMINSTLNINLKVDASKSLRELYTLYNQEENPMYGWRYNWIADYPDPENFLQLFYGDNISNYNNPKFNALFEEGSNEPNEILRNEIYLKADQELINDAAFIPLLYSDLVYLTTKNIKEFYPNSIDYRDFRQVYFEK